MNNKETKSLVKTARKALRKELAGDITKELNSVLNHFEQESKKTSKVILKASRRLAKKLSSMIKIDKSAAAKNTGEMPRAKDSKMSGSTEIKQAPVTIRKVSPGSVKDKTKLGGRTQVRKPVAQGVSVAQKHEVKKVKRARTTKAAESTI